MNREQHMDQFKQASIDLQRHRTTQDAAIKLYGATKMTKDAGLYHTMAHSHLDGILDAERKMVHHLEEATRLLGRD